MRVQMGVRIRKLTEKGGGTDGRILQEVVNINSSGVAVIDMGSVGRRQRQWAGGITASDNQT